MNTQEYELAFVGTLPKNVKVVDPHTLDFSKNPAGALAFRYKHGWILINPLIPSRGLSGGGLARQHGHLSGGHTTGHFIKGADGKMSFKAVNRYASKADWENEVKKGAAGVVAKQEAAKAAVHKAESATNAAEKLAASGASKEVQAAAHAVASKAHADAVPHFQAMGKDGLKSAVLTHSAHSAIHASKADKLGQEAKAEKAAKLEAQKAAAKAHATKLTTEANDLSASIKGSSHTPKQAAELHQKAAKAHADAKAANEAAGNKFVSEAHGQAVSKHENIAAKQQATHDALDKAAATTSDNAYGASQNAVLSSEEGDKLPAQIQAHNMAAQAHGQAANAHGHVGNDESANEHKQSQAKHALIAGGLQKQHEKQQAAQKQADEQQAAQKKADDLSKAAYSKSAATDGMDVSPEAADAHLAAAHAHLKAKIAAKAAMDLPAAYQHQGAATHHETQHKLLKDKLEMQAKEDADKKAAMGEASAKSATAHKASTAANEAGYNNSSAQAQHDQHLAAADAHTNAAVAADGVGWTKQAEGHKDTAKGHLEKAHKIKQILDGEDSKKALIQAADAASTKAYTATDAAHNAKYEGNVTTQQLTGLHLDAGGAHLDAADAAKKVGWHGLAQGHDDAAKGHAAEAKKLAASQDPDLKAKEEKKAKLSQAGQLLNDSEDAIQAGDKELAAQKAKQAAEIADEIGHHPMKVTALSDLAEMTGKKEDHQAAGLAAAKALAAENAKNNPSAFAKNKYTNLIAHHGDAADAATAKKVAEIKAPPAAKIPAKAPETAATPEGDFPLKPVGALKGTGKKLGTHGSEVMEDEAGNKWLKKADGQGYSRVLDPAVAALHRKVGLDTPVFVPTKDGHLQGMLPGAKDAFPNGGFNPEKLSDEDIIAMLKHQVMDAATGNQDTHSGQWMRTADGKLIQVDQGQSFKFGVNSDPTKTHPPLGSDVPVYPKLWNAAKAGKIQLPDPNGDNDFAKTIKALQDLPDDQFKALFKPYAVQALKNGHKPGGHSTVEGFLDDIVKHKNDLGKDFEKLYNGLPDKAKAGSSAAHNAEHSKAAALKVITENAQAGKPLSSTQIQKAKDAGASLSEIHSAHHGEPAGTQVAAKGKATSGLSQKETALKAFAEHNSPANDENWEPDTSNELKDKAKALGATQSEIDAALDDPDKFVADLTSKGAATKTAQAPAQANVLTPKEAALKALAEHEHTDNTASWKYGTATVLEEKAVAAGASEKEIAQAFHQPDAVLKSLEGKTAAATKAATPAAPEAPKAEAPKPKAKWSKAIAGIKVGGETEQHPVLAGPKGLVVHKKVGGTGWHVSSADGYTLGNKFKTQKEAKLAAEWMANNHGAKTISVDSHKEWAAANPEALTAFKKGIGEAQWNKTPEATPAKASNAGSKSFALQLLAEHNLTDNANAWDYDKDEDLKAEAKAAGATAEEIAAAAHKPKTYLKSLGLDPDAAAAADMPVQMTMFTGLGGDKKSNAVLMKELYDQAHGPNATPAMKAEYAKAQEAWTAKHSTGPFDPSKFATGAKAGSVNSAMSMDEKTKALFPTSHAAGFILIAPNVSANGDWKPTPSQKKGPLMYTSNAGYTGMNEQLRGAKIHGYDENGKYTVIGTHPPLGYPAGTQWDQYIKSSDEAFAAVPPLDKDIVTHRVMEGYKPFDAFPPPMTPGAEYTDQGYGSTTKGKSPFYGDFHMEIQIPKGRRVLDLNHTTGSKFADSSEQEILLNRGTKFRVISDTKVGNTRKVVVQVVDDGHQVDDGSLL